MTEFFEEQPVELIAEKKQIDFLLKDLYFARTIDCDEQNPYSFAIVEFGTKTKVYDVLTNEVFMPVKNVNVSAIKDADGKLAYNIIPLTKALIKAGVKEADPLLTKEDVEFLRSEIAKHLKENHPNTDLGR